MAYLLDTGYHKLLKNTFIYVYNRWTVYYCDNIFFFSQR